MIASYGIITGVDNSVTTVIAWRHLLTVLDWLDRQREHVANAALGLNHARCTGIGLQLAVQPQDLDIDGGILAFAQRDRRRIGIEQSSATPFELPALESISASFRITRSCNPFPFPAAAPRHGGGRAVP